MDKEDILDTLEELALMNLRYRNFPSEFNDLLLNASINEALYILEKNGRVESDSISDRIKKVREGYFSGSFS